MAGKFLGPMVEAPVAIPHGRHLVYKAEQVPEDPPDPFGPLEKPSYNWGTAFVVTAASLGRVSFRLERFPASMGKPEMWAPQVILADAVLDMHRRDLRNGATVLELGCGLGIPSLVCANAGGNVVATDRAKCLEPIRKNASLTGYPPFVWKVVGGERVGGVAVLGTVPPQRLKTGTLVEGLELNGANLKFRRLTGSGPDEGTVGVKKFGGGEMLALTEELPPRPVGDTRGVLRSQELDWDPEDALQIFDGPPDIVMCSDCIYEPLYGRSWQELYDCLIALCGPATTVFVSVKRRKDDGAEPFLEKIQSGMLTRLVSRTVLPEGGEVLLFMGRRLTKPEIRYEALCDARVPDYYVPIPKEGSSQPSSRALSESGSRPETRERSGSKSSHASGIPGVPE